MFVYVGLLAPLSHSGRISAPRESRLRIRALHPSSLQINHEIGKACVGGREGEKTGGKERERVCVKK